MIRRRHPVFSKLQKRLSEELGITAGQFRRTYAGYWERRQGRFTWAAITDQGKIIGSTERATDLVKAKRLVLDPEEGEIFSSD